MAACSRWPGFGWQSPPGPQASLRKALTGLLLFACASFAAQTALAEPTVVPSERVRRNVVVRAAPSTQSAPLEALEPGEQLTLDGQVPGWFRIVLPDGRTGFVSKSWTLVIDDADAAAAALASPARMHVIDVGTGLAIFIEGAGFTMIFDGGSRDDKAKGINNRLVAYLRAVRPNLEVIDHLFLSHPHEDHQELLPDVFDRYQVRHVWDSGRVQQTVGYCRFLKKVEAEPGVTYHAALPDGVPHRVAFNAGSCTGTVTLPNTRAMSATPVRLGAGAKFTVLNSDSTPHHDPNGNSIVVRLDAGSRRILLTGDAEGGERKPLGTLPKADSIEGRLLREAPTEVRADVLVAGHHGSLTSSRMAFLDQVGARIYIISSGPFDYSGVVLPDPEIRTELDRRGDLLLTNINDDQCRGAAQKIGKDNDNRPGGCSNIIVTVMPNNVLDAVYSTAVD